MSYEYLCPQARLGLLASNEITIGHETSNDFQCVRPIEQVGIIILERETQRVAKASLPTGED